MAYEIIPKYNWVVRHPLYNPTNHGFERFSGFDPFFVGGFSGSKIWNKVPQTKWFPTTMEPSPAKI